MKTVLRVVAGLMFVMSPLVALKPSDATVIRAAMTLHANDYIETFVAGHTYHKVRLVMQDDGNLVLYRITSTIGGEFWQWIWTPWTQGHPGARAVMQDDGNLVVYGPADEVLWAAGTGGNWDGLLILGGDGQLSIVNSNSQSLWKSNSSQASAATGSQAPWSSWFADSSFHTHISQESNAVHRADWQWRINGPGAEDVYEPTDLLIFEASTYTTHVDVAWYQTTNTAGIADAICTLSAGNGKCDQFRVRFSDDLAFNYSSHIKNNGVCHEWGHTVGFRDGGANAASCMTGGDNTLLRQWEIDRINGRY